LAARERNSAKAFGVIAGEQANDEVGPACPGAPESDRGDVAAVFAGRLDLARVATMGTCSGFDAAAQFYRTDPRCQAAILVSCTPGRRVSPGNNGA
jgi:hypothetical protein